MKRLLILFAKGFPYNTSEPFLENEYPLYKKHFDKVLIVTGCKKGEKPTRTIDGETVEIINDYTLSADLRSVVQSLPWLLTDKMFYKEIGKLIKNKTFSLKRFYSLSVTALCGNHRAKQAFRYIKKHPDYCADVIYGYWLNIPAYAAVRLKRKLKSTSFAVSRAHGFDLYAERSETVYLPFQEQIYNELDEIASISDNGKQYLEDKYGSKNKVSVFRLGASDKRIHNPETDRNVFRIVSCARVIPLKRLTRIVDALKNITDKEIVWTHIGNGTEYENLKNYAEKELPQNITADFRGFVPNNQVYDIYAKTPFHVFINVSETEGVPVSIMEAMSFGIPVTATAVGGTSELVDVNKNGFLLKSDFTDSDLIACIRSLADMPEAEYAAFRNAAREKFEREYNAETNYKRFIEHIADRRNHE